MPQIQYESQLSGWLLQNPAAAQKMDCSSMTADWFSGDYWQQQNAVTGSAAGRGTTLFIQAQLPMVLRRYQRGGAIRHISTDSFVYTGLQQTRPFQELHLLAYMAERGLPVPLGIAGYVWRHGLTYRAALLTERIPGASDCHQCLSHNPIAATLWQKIGSTIKQMHNAQVYHHDLNIHNLMIDDQQGVWIIDFDKCAKRAGNRWKQANLDRLHRSLIKESLRMPQYFFQENDWQQLLSGYHLS